MGPVPAVGVGREGDADPCGAIDDLEVEEPERGGDANFGDGFERKVMRRELKAIIEGEQRDAKASA